MRERGCLGEGVGWRKRVQERTKRGRTSRQADYRSLAVVHFHRNKPSEAGMVSSCTKPERSADQNKREERRKESGGHEVKRIQKTVVRETSKEMAGERARARGKCSPRVDEREGMAMMEGYRVESVG